MEAREDYRGLLDSEYDVLSSMTEEEVINYLLDFGATKEEATEAVESMGAW